MAARAGTNAGSTPDGVGTGVDVAVGVGVGDGDIEMAGDRAALVDGELSGLTVGDGLTADA
ncbi:MAG TPA: hypothetical protein VGR77_04980 [Candidatus Dormibacteraeota bacterium]|nr:hypothetical protein [Candidatus Dormibacteraeota bacterium]